MSDIGFLSIAQNSDVDYFRLCYFQCLFLKKSMPQIPYSVIVDCHTFNDIPEKCKNYFNSIILLEEDYAAEDNWKLSNEPQIYNLTPYYHTIKLESDLLITRDITHWISALSTKDIVFSHGCKNFLQEKSNSKFYRHFLVDNDLPDIYNGLMYFKRSELSRKFFDISQTIFLNWKDIAPNFKNYINVPASTDFVYAIAAKILGVENFILPTLEFFNFVHMKKYINNWSFNNWPDVAIHEFDDSMIRIANINQYYPVHYHDKNLITDDLIARYE